MNKLLGYTPGQWVTVFKKYPPISFDFEGVAGSRRTWKAREALEPKESKVTPKFGTAWDRFVATLHAKV